MKKAIIPVISILILSQLSFCQQKGDKSVTENNSTSTTFEIEKPDSAWKKILTPEQYQVLREKGTEYAFSGKYYLYDKKGIYRCAACGNPLFDSKTKYHSGSGWPSFYKPIDEDAVVLRPDNSDGMKRTEILCGRCGGHLGHVFEDGPKPTGLRYCVNSIAMEFEKKNKKD